MLYCPTVSQFAKYVTVLHLLHLGTSSATRACNTRQHGFAIAAKPGIRPRSVVGLHDLGIPFMFHTRYDATEARQKWPGAPVVTKPASAKELIRAVAELLH